MVDLTGAAGALRTAVTGNWRTVGQKAGAVGLTVGLVAAGAAAGVAVERLTIGRSMKRRARDELDAAAPFGTLRGEPRTVLAEDGTELYAEVDEPGTESGAEPGTDPLTVVFCHGYTLNQDSWHFQRAALHGQVRMVFWDQRSHGRSARGPLAPDLSAGQADFTRLGHDLHAVIEELAPSGPLVLVGHSMGGMTVMAFAGLHPELMERRVAGVALLSTTAGEWATAGLGLPGPAGRLVHRAAPGLLRVLGRQAGLVEWGRRLSSEVSAPFIKRYSFVSRVDPVVARFAERMIEATPIDVVAEFLPAFYAHDTTEALRALRGIPTLVLHGDGDLLVPPEHATAIAEAVPGAERALVQEAGHLVLLEHPELVDRLLSGLLAAAHRQAGRPVPTGIAALADGPAGCAESDRPEHNRPEHKGAEG
jgi:pimeloyl-ACP methyl ester carboxylesterase